ncbi:NLR family CARD domain-containing protein 3-like [Dermacentor albipictus]|uniref:NLR family CARD domain-containing protein 3-like n=1 Tax=Dermacentor albipictus TaxID=60249 RepID=UPI0038FC8D50
MSTTEGGGTVAGLASKGTAAGGHESIMPYPEQIVSRLTKRGLDFDRACEYDECHADCWLCHDLDRWSKVLHPVSFELVETEPARVAIRSTRTRRRQLGDDQLYDAAYVFSWLPKAHRCVLRIMMQDPRSLLFAPASTLALALGRSVNVQHLQLRGGNKKPYCEEELSEGLAGLGNLKSLELYHFPISASVSRSVANLLRRNASHLTAVSISDNDMSQESVECLLRALQCCRFLGELSVVANDIPRESVNSIARLLRVAKSLTKLTLNESLDDGVNLSTLAEALKANTSLLELHIGWCYTRFEPLFEALTTNKTLKHLDLKGCNINDSNAESLATALVSNKGLKKLELMGTYLDADSMVTLAHKLKENTALELLDLRYNTVTVRAVNTFCRMLRNNKTLKSVLFSEVQATQQERSTLSVEMAQAEGYNRIQMSWAEADLPPLSAAVALGSESLTELHLSVAYELTEIGICALLQNLATNKYVRTVTVGLGDHKQVAVALCRVLALNQTIQNLKIKICSYSAHGLLGMVAKALATNTTVSQVCLESYKVSLKSLKSIAFMLTKNTAITNLKLNTGSSMPTNRLAIISRALVKSQSIVDFTLTPVPNANHASSRMFTSIRRNTSLLNVAVRFLTHQRLDRQAAVEFEALSEKASLVPHLMKVTEQTEDEAKKAVVLAKRYIQSNYFQLAGIVRENVVFHLGKGRDIRALNYECLSAIARYLKLSDVVSVDCSNPTRQP